MRFLRTGLALVAALLILVPAPRAQEAAPEDPPTNLALLEGSVTLTRDNERDAAAAGTPLVPGDVVRTDRGRADLLFPDGSALDLDEYSTLEILSPTLVRLSEGRLILSVAGASEPASAARFVVDTPVASAETHGPGEYRLSMLRSPTGIQAEFAVVRGSAALVNERGATPLRAAQRSFAWDETAPSPPQSFNAGRLDAFAQWSASLRDDRVGSASTRHLPSELRTYSGALDRSGAWQYENDYGYVWYPTVDADWQPYDDGYWSAVPVYGWTWIGVDVWSWPTHHYGRWGYARSRWFWIPDRRWAPAWVSWGAAPGYVSWCPLGLDNRPVSSWAVSSRNRWERSGWTIVSRDRFGERGRSVRHDAISLRALPANTPFITQTSAPPPPSRAAMRRSVVGPSAPGGRTNTSSRFGVTTRAPAVSAPVPGGRERWPPAPPPSRPPGTALDRAVPGVVPRDAAGSAPSRSDIYSQPEPGRQRMRQDEPSSGRGPARTRIPAIDAAPAPLHAGQDAPAAPSPSSRLRTPAVFSLPAPPTVPRAQEGSTRPERRPFREIERANGPRPPVAEPARPGRESAPVRSADALPPQPASRANGSSGRDRSSEARAVPRGRDGGSPAPEARAQRPSGDRGDGRGRSATRPR